MCSTFIVQGEPCEYKFTSNWLSEPENCTAFINHMKSRHGFGCVNDVKTGLVYTTRTAQTAIESATAKSLLPANHYFQPIFFRFQNLAQDKEQLLFRITLFRADSSGNKTLSSALVQLTPEIKPIVAKITMNANANSKMVSQWGQHSTSTLSWTVKAISFKEFRKLVKVSQNAETRPLFPFSLPVSFLSEYYVGDCDGKIVDTMVFELKD